MARVLVIDDDEEIRTLLQHMLEGSGHEVDQAVDGAEALRMFSQRRSDLVITDIHGGLSDDAITMLRLVERSSSTDR